MLYCPDLGCGWGDAVDILFKRGIYLPEIGLWMDSLRKQECSLISHGHSDHTARHTHPILTSNTHLILSEYLQKSDPIILEYREPFETSEYKLTMYPAGHCLGSAQSLIESKRTGERILYTGDFKVRTNSVNEPLEHIPCDILIMESTYGRPEYTFPPEEEVISYACETIKSWLKRGAKPIVRGWKLGKAQEIIYKLLENKFDIRLEESIFQMTSKYIEAGIQFPGKIQLFDGNWQDGTVLVCPLGSWTKKHISALRAKRIMDLTGWANTSNYHWGGGADCSLQYSDHADFSELVAYAQQANPRQIYTVNGFPELSTHLRELGYPSVHLDDKGISDHSGFQMKML